MNYPQVRKIGQNGENRLFLASFTDFLLNSAFPFISEKGSSTLIEQNPVMGALNHAKGSPLAVLSRTALEPLLLHVPSLVVSVHLPVSILIIGEKFNSIQPLGTLPPVQMRDERPSGKACCGRSGLPFSFRAIIESGCSASST